MCGVTLASVAAAPVIVLVGEPLRRYCVRRLGRRPRRTRAGAIVTRLIIANPVLIALTAPERWAIDQLGGLLSGGVIGRGFGRFRRRGGNGPPPAGMREPRRPLPSAPAGAIALAEPLQQHRVRVILKGIPQALSEPVRRARSRAGRMTRLLRSRTSRLRP